MKIFQFKEKLSIHLKWSDVRKLKMNISSLHKEHIPDKVLEDPYYSARTPEKVFP